MAKQIKITQIRSTIHAVPKHRRTIEALGFHRTYQTLVKNDTPQIRGMIRQVRHLVRVEEVK
jgi:large subunit ribosomal protein L30